VLPCVDVFVADEFCVWAPILWTCLALRWGAQLADVPCVCVADVRWGAQLADVPCIALGRPTCGRALRCVWAPILRTLAWVYLHAKICSYPSSSSSFILVLPCVDVFLRMSFSFGRPSCEIALRCVWAPILRTRLALRWGAQPW
jgi:hypothetical protein